MKRTTVLLDDEVHADLIEYIPHGFRRHVLANVMKLVAEAVKREGNPMIAALMDGEYKLVRDRADVPN